MFGMNALNMIVFSFIHCLSWFHKNENVRLEHVALQFSRLDVKNRCGLFNFCFCLFLMLFLFLTQPMCRTVRIIRPLETMFQRSNEICNIMNCP